MNNTSKIPVVVFIAVALLLILSASVFTVDERQKAIVLQFGQPVAVYQEAGLKFKLPWPIQNVRYFDARVMDVDPGPERFTISSDRNSPLLKDTEVDQAIIEEVSGEPIIVDTFARYRIAEPLLYLQRLGTEEKAAAQIESVMETATRNVLGKASLREILSSARGGLMEKIRDQVNAQMEPRGIEIVDIRIVRADLTERLRASTVNRMITERKELATQTRAKGQEKALEIRAMAEKERAVILAEAERDAQIIRGQGDKEAAEIYARAYNKDKDFYAFVRSMEAYNKALASGDTAMILSPDSAFLRYLSEK